MEGLCWPRFIHWRVAHVSEYRRSFNLLLKTFLILNSSPGPGEGQDLLAASKGNACTQNLLRCIFKETMVQTFRESAINLKGLFLLFHRANDCTPQISRIDSAKNPVI